MTLLGSRVSKTMSAGEGEGGGRGTRLRVVAMLLEGALSPNNCRRSEAEKGLPCSKLRGIHKLTSGPGYAKHWRKW